MKKINISSILISLTIISILLILVLSKKENKYIGEIFSTTFNYTKSNVFDNNSYKLVCFYDFDGCSYCINKMFQSLNEIHEKNEDIMIIPIIEDTIKANIYRTITQYSPNFRIYNMESFNFRNFPDDIYELSFILFFINKSGEIKFVYKGRNPINNNYMEIFFRNIINFVENEN
jgi:hypothetical protein